MISAEYRDIIARMALKIIKKHFPGLKKDQLQKVSREIAINIHARMYGANVDGVDSPIWSANGDHMNDTRTKPKIDAQELLNGERSDEVSRSNLFSNSG